VEYKINACLPFIIFNNSVNKDLTEEMELIKSCFRQPEIFLKTIF